MPINLKVVDLSNYISHIFLLLLFCFIFLFESDTSVMSYFRASKYHQYGLSLSLTKKSVSVFMLPISMYC